MIKWLKKDTKLSYSQSGEDRIVSFIFDWIGIKSPTYLDVGAHHSSFLSNTYLFYTNGSKGVCVEPDPDLFEEVAKVRTRDICLNIGIAAGSQEFANFYIMSAKSLNTFSEDEAKRCQDTKNFGNQKIEQIIKIPLKSINEVMDDYFPKGVNFVSIDVEGLDSEIIFSFDFLKYQPDVFCIETLRYQENSILIKNTQLIEHMISNGYFIYGETYINTIFVSNRVKELLI